MRPRAGANLGECSDCGVVYLPHACPTGPKTEVAAHWVYTAEMPEQIKGWRPTPDFGSAAARALGCTCPSDQPKNPRRVTFAGNCPLPAHQFHKRADA